MFDNYDGIHMINKLINLIVIWINGATSTYHEEVKNNIKTKDLDIHDPSNFKRSFCNNSMVHFNIFQWCFFYEDYIVLASILPL